MSGTTTTAAAAAPAAAKGSAAWAHKAQPRTLVLFDVDGTLTPARKEIGAEMRELLVALRERVVLGFVGGSDLCKQQEQLGANGGSYLSFRRLSDCPLYLCL